MSTSKNAKMTYESGQSYSDFAAMTDSGDGIIFTASGGLVLSGRSGFEPSIRPNGIVTGRNLLSVHATNDTVAVAAFTAYSEGVEQEVDATSIAITRPASAVAKICSVTMEDDGTVAVVAGTDSTTTAFSAVRGAAGGPPEIPADSVELGQVRVVSDTAAALVATEIFQVSGTHTERYDLPSFTSNNVGAGDSASVPAKKNAYVEFADAIPAIHASATKKKVYIAFYSPIYAQIQRAVDFVPAENTHSLSSQQFYDGAVGSVASSLGQAGFTAYMSDNVTDSLVALKDEILTFKFFPDKNKLPYIVTQGIMGMGRTFPVDSQNEAAVTISAENLSANFAS